MNMKEISDWVATKATLVVGTNLFAGEKPQSKNPLLYTILRAEGGTSNETDGTNVRRKMVQFLTMGETYPAAEAEAYRLYNLFVNHGRQDLTTGTILSILGGEPVYLGVNEKDLRQFSCNLQFSYKPKG